MDATSQIIDRIYGAALNVTAWQGTLRVLQARLNGIASGLYSVDMASGQVSLVELCSIDPEYHQRYVDDYLHDNPWARAPALQQPGCIRTEQSLDAYYNSPGFYRGTALYNEWMKPQDFIYTLGTNLLVEGSVRTKFFIYRARQTGAFNARDIAYFDWLRGHLTNAVRVARRLAQQEALAGTCLDTIDHLEFGIVLLNEHGRVMQTNHFTDALLRAGNGLLIRRDRLVAPRREDSKRLAAVVHAAQRLHQGQAAPASLQLCLHRPGGKRPLSIVAVPLPRHHSNPFLIERASVALIVTDPEHTPALPTEWLQQHYALTAAEARLAQRLAQGIPLRQAAAQLEVTYETTRSCLKSVFQKTGTSRQPELVHRLLSDRIAVRHS